MNCTKPAARKQSKHRRNRTIEGVDYDAQAAATELFTKKILPEIRSW
jgi:hypothetical protein